MAVPASPVVVFDLDGTLADTAPDLIATLNAILAGEGRRPLALAEAGALIGVGARALIERGLADGGPVDPERLDALYAAFLDLYAERLCVATRLYPGARAALARLAASGYRLAVCTNKFEAHARGVLKGLGILDHFDALSGRDTFGVCKPDPRHILMTVAAAGGDPGAAVMVGDSRTDIAAARAAGIPVIGVTFGYTDVPIAALDPDAVVDAFDGIEAAVARLAPAGRPREPLSVPLAARA
ncbi:MAG TPA: HAD-IA family hydrolase [Salinarimonas sp.]|jgi:phosphoglycolate phosphatase|nr:HAD-IA family hydrolase [Salinarimonas sp.]